MHILYVTTELATADNSSGGLASFTANISRIFYNNGHEVSIIVVSTKKELLRFDTGINLQLLYVPKKAWNIMNYVSYLFSWTKDGKDEWRKYFVNKYKSKLLKKMIRKMDKVDIIHYCNFGGLAMYADKKIPYCIRLSSAIALYKSSCSLKGDYETFSYTVKDRYAEKAVKKAKYVIAPSYLVSDFYKKNYNIDVEVLESPFFFKETQINRKKAAVIGTQKYILYYGSLNYQKGIHVVAGLTKKFLESHQDMCLVLAGNSEYIQDENGVKIKAHEIVIKRAEEYKDRVIYLGRLVREELYPIIQNAELCIFPSRIENLSNACIEAMAMGKIVVATDGASYEQLIIDGQNGFLCERDNAESFLRGIEKVLSFTDKEKKEISNNAQKTVERLSPENIYRKYLEYYEKVIREW